MVLCKRFLISRLHSFLLFLALLLEASTLRLRVIRQLDYVHRTSDRRMTLSFCQITFPPPMVPS